MSTDGHPEQLSRAELTALAKKSPEAVVEAMKAGRLSDLFAGRDPGSCPSCGRPMSDPPPAAA